MDLLDKKYFQQYIDEIGYKIPDLIQQYDFSEDTGNFNYLTKSSAVYSSNIEGNSIDLNSYMNYEMLQSKFQKGKEVEEITNLIHAYEFAQSNQLNAKNVCHCHNILSKTILIKSKRGRYRIEPVGVFGKAGLSYMAVEPEFVEVEMKKFFDTIEKLLLLHLDKPQVFYFASLLHLRFVHIHPFMDGNGRIARLIEKWFVAQLLGHRFWKIPSEEYYKIHQKQYYAAIDLGVNFYELDYTNCIDFLTMLPNCLKMQHKA